MVTVLALAHEERKSEKVKMYPYLYDKTTKGYKEKDVLQNLWNVLYIMEYIMLFFKN